MDSVVNKLKRHDKSWLKYMLIKINCNSYVIFNQFPFGITYTDPDLFSEFDLWWTEDIIRFLQGRKIVLPRCMV